MNKTKHKPDDPPEKVYCYLCDRVILKFNTPEAERMFSKTGLCEKCQKDLKKGIDKCNF